MLSLSDQIHNFLAEWDANQQMGKREGVGEGECDLCGRQRFVQYDISVDRSFCSPRCAKKYIQVLNTGAVYVR